MASHRSQRAAERREYDPLDPAKQHAPVTAGALVSGYLDSRMLAGASDASRALVTWRRIAGKRAAKHTAAVWLNQPKSGDGLPEMVVYLDGNGLMQDLTTNAELYVDRLAYAGLPVARVRFRLSRKAGQRTGEPGVGEGVAGAAGAPGSASGGASAGASAARRRGDDLPPLSVLEAAQVEQAVAQLPERLRASASEAMKFSIRRSKAESTGTKPNSP